MEKKTLFFGVIALIGVAALCKSKADESLVENNYPIQVFKIKYGFLAYNLNQKQYLEELLYVTSDTTIDLELRNLNQTQLSEWKTDWINIVNTYFTGSTEKSALLEFIESKYDEYYSLVNLYPKILNLSGYLFNVPSARVEEVLRAFNDPCTPSDYNAWCNHNLYVESGGGCVDWNIAKSQLNNFLNAYVGYLKDYPQHAEAAAMLKDKWNACSPAGAPKF